MNEGYSYGIEAALLDSKWTTTCKEGPSSVLNVPKKQGGAL